LSLRIVGTDLRILNMRARMPFRYGIATMTATPHLFCRVELEIDGRRQAGTSADHLPPKWFTKDPRTSVRDDVAEMIQVITTACDIARAAPKSATVFDLWRRVYDGQAAWGGGWGKPPLLSHFGSSLVERAAIDAFCRHEGVSFARAVRRNWLGVKLGQIHPELEGAEPKELLPAEPLRSVVARHTVGLSDPLTDGEVGPEERVDDGLPQSLEACIRVYGLTHFKIKLFGDVAKDVERVGRCADVIERTLGRDAKYAHTLDGNENFKAVGPLREFWEKLTGEPRLAGFLRRLIFVEQPLHRDVALGPEAAKEFAAWGGRPATIIDESDGELSSSRKALEAGYVGTSHKNCKGVFKGIANACLIEHRRREDRSREYVLSGEDLCNVGPVALPQDLAAAATLGVGHLERNGHHYFRGLTMLPERMQETVLHAHPDLYRRHEAGFPTVAIEGGRMRIGSAVEAPFGINFEPDSSQFTPAAEWKFESL
jgi:hypothetical protein